MQTSQSCFPQKNIRRLLDKFQNIIRKILPIYWAFLTFMLLKPGVEKVHYPFMFEGIDKIVHFGIFTFLGFLFHATFPRMKFSIFLQVLLIYALLTEILQDELHWGRSLEFMDLVADAIGILAGFYFARKWSVYTK